MAKDRSANPNAHDVEDDNEDAKGKDQTPTSDQGAAKDAPAATAPGPASVTPPSERKGATPATAPASQPDAAVAQPASGNAPKVVRPVLGSVRDPKLPFEDDPAKVLPGLPKAKVEDLMRKVHCHVIDGFKGRIKNKLGSFTAFSFVKHEVVILPKWFASSHPTRFVIKE